MNNDISQIIEEKLIDTVFQPIVSLATGIVEGYEALSRITANNPELGIEGLFSWAKKNGYLWELEKVCRMRALENGRCKPCGAKLFLNVDANIMYDPNLKAGFTRQILRKYNLIPAEVIIEVTEKSSIVDHHAFAHAIEHYKSQEFSIAIDDFGAGYSGINRACAYAPEYIKLDMEMVRNVQDDALKKAAIKGIVQFCKESNIKVIAEGIENREELLTLLSLGVDYGQGYFLGKPKRDFEGPSKEFLEVIGNYHKRTQLKKANSSVFGLIGTIVREGNTAYCQESGVQLFYQVQKDESVYQICVLDDENRVCGVITRNEIMEQYGGPYGYDLNIRKKAKDLMKKDFLTVQEDATVDEVAARAMKREPRYMYDDVVVMTGDYYLGSVSVKDLLMTSINLQVEKAADASPLTGLPGNAAIQKVLSSKLEKRESFGMAYLDLDSFKSYNDEYGFAAGDSMIRRLAQIIWDVAGETDFCGHVGGDDFVIIGSQGKIEEECDTILKDFSRSIPELYRKEDLKRGYMMARDRNGFETKLELATISTAIVYVFQGAVVELEELSEEIARVKSMSKQKKGNSIVVSYFGINRQNCSLIS